MPASDRADWTERLRAAVARSGKKHSALARDAGITPETLSKVLNGHRPLVHFETVVSIVHAAGETVGWVLGERGYVLTAYDVRRIREGLNLLAKVIGDER